MMKSIIAAVCGVCVSSSAWAASAEAELKQFVENVNTLSARFVQTQTDEHGEVVSSGAGQMALARPGKFRWAYEQPYTQLMVCDGQRIWAYDPDLAQVTVRPAGEALAGTPAELLASRARLSDNFSVQDRGEQNGLRKVGLEPKSAESDFKSIELWLKAGVPARLRFNDPLGGTTDVELHDVKVNAAIDAQQFRFTPPKGVEVVESVAAH
ncbi:MAG: outer membrane lipoprotein chaperone LolA [Panacagrimonas sp.]